MQAFNVRQSAASLQKKDFKSVMSRVLRTPRAAKAAVIVVFTLCWLLIALVRSNAPYGPSPEGSSLMGLARALQQGAVSGRDFHSIFGPGTQLLAWAATAVADAQSPLDAYGMIAFFFCAASAILIAVMLLVCNRVSWKEAAVVYVFCFLLNLFFGILDFRTALLLLIAAFAYRIIAAETLRQQRIWASATGLLCFFAQLVTFELGIYAVLLVVAALIAGSRLTRNADVLGGIEGVVAIAAAANVALVVFFKMTSANYGMVFDYPSYSLEILRGYHNSMGILWQLSLRDTVALVAITLYVIGACFIVVRRADPLDASLFASLAFLGVIWLNTAWVRSDIPHITVAFTPIVVLLALLSTKLWQSTQERVVWAAGAVALFFVWPSFNASAPLDLLELARGRIQAGAAIGNLYKPEQPVEAALLPDWMTSASTERGDVSVLAFPYGNQIGAGLRRPFFAPVLESYAASTDALESYYVEALDERSPAAVDIIYGPDKGMLQHINDTQAITRTPNIFEYIYKHFELASHEDYMDGLYALRERDQPRDAAPKDMGFFPVQQLADRGVLRLTAPSACGLVRMQMRIDYDKNPLIFRPSGVELALTDADRRVWEGVVRAIKPNSTFVTYVSPLPRETFPQVFGQGVVQGVKWDRIEYQPLPSDLLGSKAVRIRVEKLQCLDPEKFVEGGSQQS